MTLFKKPYVHPVDEMKQIILDVVEDKVDPYEGSDNPEEWQQPPKNWVPFVPKPIQELNYITGFFGSLLVAGLVMLAGWCLTN